MLLLVQDYSFRDTQQLLEMVLTKFLNKKYHNAKRDYYDSVSQRLL